MANKTRKNIKCNYFIKRYSIERIQDFTDMKLSDINDRLMDGMGIITKDDYKVLKAAKALSKLLCKINFPAFLNQKFHNFLVDKQRGYRSSLKHLIETLEAGSKPIYYADIANEKYKFELKALNKNATITHDTIQAVFSQIIYDFTDDENTYGYSAYFAMVKDYKLRAKQITGRRIDGMNLFYDELRLNDYTTQEIIDKAFEMTNFFYSAPSTDAYSSEMGGDIISIIFDDNPLSRLLYYRCIPFESRYYIMTRHKKLSNPQFRDNIEFIADIPSITNGRSEQMISQLNMDIELLENFAIEKKTIKKESLKTLAISGKRLINFYNGKWMKNFAIPEL